MGSAGITGAISGVEPGQNRTTESAWSLYRMDQAIYEKQCEYLITFCSTKIEHRYFRRRAMRVANHQCNIRYTYGRSFPCAIQNITDRLLMLFSISSVMMGCDGFKSGFPLLDRILMLLHKSTVSFVRHKKFARLNNERAASILPSSNCMTAIP
jgi:hypothetical protein